MWCRINLNAMKKFLQTLWDAFALSSLRALFDSDAHRIISREGEEYLNELDNNKNKTT